MEDENPKGKVKFLKGGEFPKGGRISLGISPPGRAKLNCVGGGGEIPGTLAQRRGLNFSSRMSAKQFHYCNKCLKIFQITLQTATFG